jgi:hypothetical protein
VGVRQPLRGKEIAVSTERLREKWQWRMQGLSSRSNPLLKAELLRGVQWLEESSLDSWANRQILPQMVKLPHHKSRSIKGLTQWKPEYKSKSRKKFLV